MRTVTLVEFRNQTSAILEAVEGGEEVLLTRRGKPSVRLVAAEPKTWSPPSSDDPVFRVHDFAVDGDPSLPHLSNEEADRLLYGN